MDSGDDHATEGTGESQRDRDDLPLTGLQPVNGFVLFPTRFELVDPQPETFDGSSEFSGV
jgi:hypothetical protein